MSLALSRELIFTEILNDPVETLQFSKSGVDSRCRVTILSYKKLVPISLLYDLHRVVISLFLHEISDSETCECYQSFRRTGSQIGRTTCQRV